MGKAVYKDLIVWQKSDILAKQIYFDTRGFPKEEMYGVTSQLRRAGLSVPTNIVEGYARRCRGDLRRFVSISLGSLAEVEYLLEFTFGLGYLNKNNYNSLISLKDEVGRLLWKYYDSI